MIDVPDGGPKRIAVVGGGVAGLTAAYLLNRKHHVTLFEENAYLGGHTNTVTVTNGPDEGTPVDTGFIVMNNENYPLFGKLLDQLGVERADSNMSFSYWCRESGFYYSGRDINGLLAQRRNLVRPRFLKMVSDLMRFYREAPAHIDDESLDGATLGDYLDRERFSPAFIKDHLIPIGAAIWSSPLKAMLDYPARPFLKFFQNHGLLTVNERHQWRYIRGGSQTYVRALTRTFADTTHLKSPVRKVERTLDGVTVMLEDGPRLRFDDVVIATHADQALALLGDPDSIEQSLLGAWTYTRNHTVLHTWPGVLPPRRRAWASWNFSQPRRGLTEDPASVSYYMNALQKLDTPTPYIVTLNRPDPIPDEHVLFETVYTHPSYDFKALDSQSRLPGLNGSRHTWFCGSYFGNGFHEDAVRSGVAVAQDFGVAL